MEWYEYADGFEEASDYQLESLAEVWQRELVALERAISNIFNGGYLQFLANGRPESYVYATQAFKRIGAPTMAKILDRCQALVEQHFPTEGKSQDQLIVLMINEMHGPKGKIRKEAGSVLPESVIDEIYDLSYKFMEDPDDYFGLAQAYFGPLIEGLKQSGPGSLDELREAQQSELEEHSSALNPGSLWDPAGDQLPKAAPSYEGFTPQTAIQVGSIAEQCDWIQKHFPDDRSSYQRPTVYDGRSLDVFTIHTVTGETRLVYFDVDSFRPCGRTRGSAKAVHCWPADASDLRCSGCLCFRRERNGIAVG